MRDVCLEFLQTEHCNALFGAGSLYVAVMAIPVHCQISVLCALRSVSIKPTSRQDQWAPSTFNRPKYLKPVQFNLLSNSLTLVSPFEYCQDSCRIGTKTVIWSWRLSPSLTVAFRVRSNRSDTRCQKNFARPRVWYNSCVEAYVCHWVIRFLGRKFGRW